jgi:hypothetical protein
MSEGQITAKATVIFLSAAGYIRRYGWQREGMGEEGQARCSMGALASAYPKISWEKSLARLMYETLYRELNGLSLTQFNSKYQDGEKVAKLYERAAARLQGGVS